MSVTATALPVHLYLLGRFCLERGGAAIVLPRRKLQLLLAFLALQPQPHSREQLATRFWGDHSDARARSSLRNALPILRKRLGPDLLQIDRETVQLNPAFPLWIDAREFAGDGSGVPNPSEIERLQTEIGLYRGELLADFYDDWVLAERERFRTRWIEKQLRLAQLWRAQSEYTRAIETARRLLLTDPANETAYQNLMVCCLALGNRGAARQQFEACRRALRDELGVEPSAETLALHASIQRASAAHAAPAAQLTNLPVPLSSFVGRQHEIATVKAMLEQTRLLTLAGAGGCGKTRLAIEVGREVIERFPDGVWWSELAPLSDPALVLPAVAQALGLRAARQPATLEALAEHLRAKQLLLVLDNCEHLVAACAQIAEHLLRACPDLKLLATSRQVLGLTGGVVWHLPALSLPRPGAAFEGSTGEFLAGSEAVQLFVTRAVAVQPTFALSEHNGRAVAQICRRLDGIPLALELAARQMATLSAEQLAQRLDRRLDILSAGQRTALSRHATLRAAIDWSYELLTAEARGLLRRLAVFRGGFSLAAAEAVWDAGERAQPEVAGWLAQLVDQSLASVDYQDPLPRYVMLETIREYAWEKLVEAGEADEARGRHLNYFTQLVEQAEQKVGTAQGMTWRAAEIEIDNIRAALDWARASGAVEWGLRLGSSMWHYWEARGHPREGYAWLEGLLNLEAPVAPAVRRKALHDAAVLVLRQSNYVYANRLLDASLALARELGDQKWIAIILNSLGLVCDVTGDYEAAARYWQESLGIYRSLDDKASIALELDNLGQLALRVGDNERAAILLQQCLALAPGSAFGVLPLVLFNLGDLAQAQGNTEKARDLYQQSLDHYQGMGSKWWGAVVKLNLGRLFVQAGDTARGLTLITESLDVHTKAGDKVYIAECVEALAHAALSAPHRDRAPGAERSARLFGVAAALRDQIGAPLPPYQRDHHRGALDALRAELGDDRFAQAVAKGRARVLQLGQTLEQAIEAALNG